MITRLTLLIQLLIFFLTPAVAQPQIELIPRASGFSLPIDIASAGDDRLFILQQRGLIRILDPGGNIKENPFLDLTDLVSQSGNERGLLGLAFHPQYEQNGYFLSIIHVHQMEPL